VNGVLLITLVLTGTALLWAVLLTVQAHEHKRYVGKSLRNRPRMWHTPPGVLVCVPCKGVDFDLALHLRAILTQDYPNYRVRYVVDSVDDPACAVIRQLMSTSSVPCELLIAGNCIESGQKVHNLCHATAELPDDVEVLVFFDSDARPPVDTVARFVEHCCRGGLEVVTGYRWLVPRRPSLANLTLASINAAVAGLMKRHGWNLIWGGSWAMSRELFLKTAVADAWRGTLSDDLVASRVMRRAGIDIVFEPGCMAASPIDVTWWEAAAFLRRQFLICRCYAPLWWWATVPLMVLQPFVLFGGFFLAWLLARNEHALWFWPLIVSSTLYVLAILRSHWRQSNWINRVPGTAKTLRTTARFDNYAAPWSCLFAAGTMLMSAVGRSIMWRGIYYHIGPAGRVTLLGRVPDEQQRRSMLRANRKRIRREKAALIAASSDEGKATTDRGTSPDKGAPNMVLAKMSHVA
jgi:hypothetical protein